MCHQVAEVTNASANGRRPLSLPLKNRSLADVFVPGLARTSRRHDESLRSQTKKLPPGEGDEAGKSPSLRGVSRQQDQWGARTRTATRDTDQSPSGRHSGDTPDSGKAMSLVKKTEFHVCNLTAARLPHSPSPSVSLPPPCELLLRK